MPPSAKRPKAWTAWTVYNVETGDGYFWFVATKREALDQARGSIDMRAIQVRIVPVQPRLRAGGKGKRKA